MRVTTPSMGLLALLLACRSAPPVAPAPTPPAPTDPTSSWPDTGTTTLPTASSTGHTGHTDLLGTSTSDTSSTDVTGTTATTGGTASPTGRTGHTASTAASTGRTGTTADTGQVTATTGDTTARSTAHTGTAHTGRSVTADTSDTAHTGDTGPTADTAAPIVDTVCEADLLPDDTASTGDTATSSVPTGDTGDTGPEPIDTGPCGVVPPPPVDTAPPPVADTAEPECDPGCLAACPQVEWVFHLPGGTDVSLFDMESMPDGGFILAGDDERGVTFNEGLPDEIVVDETCPSVFNDAFLARIDGAGHTTWAHRVVDSCDTAHMEEASVAADGVISLHGDYFAAVATIAPHAAAPVALSTPVDLQDEWVAAYAPDGTFLQGHGIATESDQDSVMAVTTDDEGNLYAIGDFDQRVTFDAGTPQEHTLTHTGIAMFVISWDPTGAVRWSHIDALDAEYRTIEIYDAFAENGQLSIIAKANGTLWDACGPHETLAYTTREQANRWRIDFDEIGGVTSVLDFIPATAAVKHTNTGDVYVQGLLPSAAIQVGDVVLAADVEHYILHTSQSLAAPSWVQPVHGFNVRDFDAQLSTGAIAGDMVNSDYHEGVAGCGAPITVPQRPDTAAWYVLRDGEGVCGGVFGQKANYGSQGVAVDVEEAVYVGMTWFGDGIAAEGTPHELRLDPPDSDVVIVKYSW